jgi:hypothetical protein
MKTKKLAVFTLLVVVLLVGAACGGGRGVEPTPTPTSTTEPTAAPVSTATPTSTIDLAFCPPPEEGKANIAGVLTWNGTSYYEKFRVRGVVELKVYGDWLEIAGVKYSEGTVIARDSTDFDGYYCFRNIEPGEYMVEKSCPAGTKALMKAFIGSILAKANQTYWVEMDPYTVCTD